MDILKIVGITYLIGIILCFYLLIGEVNKEWRYKTKRELLSSVFRNTWKFWLTSWYGFFLILLKRRTDGRN